MIRRPPRSTRTDTPFPYTTLFRSEYKILTLSKPERLVVDLPGVDPVRGLELPAAAGLVKDVRTGQPVPGTTRIVFDLLAPVVALKPRFESGANGTRLVVEWPGDDIGDPSARIAAASASRPVADRKSTRLYSSH